jgi:hypothetical protein
LGEKLKVEEKKGENVKEKDGERKREEEEKCKIKAK